MDEYNYRELLDIIEGTQYWYDHPKQVLIAVSFKGDEPIEDCTPVNNIEEAYSILEEMH